jgi:hypothetical protein
MMLRSWQLKKKLYLWSIDCCYTYANQWVVESNSYNIAITYIKGKKNVMPLCCLQTKFNRIYFVCFDHIQYKEKNHVADYLVKQWEFLEKIT